MASTPAAYLAFTAPLNPPGSTTLTRDQVWAGLHRKVRHAEEFVGGAITATDVISEYKDEHGRDVVEREVIEMVLDEWPCRSFAGDRVLDTWIVDHHTLYIKVLLVLLVQHAGSDVGTVLTSVTFTSNIDISTMKVKEVHKVLPEWEKLSGDVELIRRVRLSLGETGTYWLVDKDLEVESMSVLIHLFEVSYSTNLFGKTNNVRKIGLFKCTLA